MCRYGSLININLYKPKRPVSLLHRKLKNAFFGEMIVKLLDKHLLKYIY